MFVLKFIIFLVTLLPFLFNGGLLRHNDKLCRRESCIALYLILL